MIGLPLRLLAREVYDRVSARIGEDRVALITGEEKRVPARPTISCAPPRRCRSRVRWTSWPSTRCSWPRTRSAVTSSPIDCCTRVAVVRRGSWAPAPCVRSCPPWPLRVRKNVPGYPATFAVRISFAPAATYRHRRLLAARLVRDRGSPEAIARGTARCWARYLRARATRRSPCSKRVRSIRWSRRTPSAWPESGRRARRVRGVAQIRRAKGARARSGRGRADRGQSRPLPARRNVRQRAPAFTRSRLGGTRRNPSLRAVRRVRYRNTALDFASPAALLESLHAPPFHSVLAASRARTIRSRSKRSCETLPSRPTSAHPKPSNACGRSARSRIFAGSCSKCIWTS